MHCDDPLADQLIPLALDRLENGERRAVEAHVAACNECTRRLELVRWMRGEASAAGAALFEDHVPLPDLTAFCESPELLTPETLVSIRRHLDLCTGCAEDLAVLRRVNEEMKREPQSAAEAAPRWGWSRWRLPRLRPWPAIAVVLLLALLYPAFLGLRSVLIPGRSAEIQTPHAVYNLTADSERGTKVTPTFPLPRSGNLTLLFHAPMTTEEGVRYDAVLQGGDSRVLWRRNGMTSLDRFGTFLILLKPTALRPGAYTLILRETESNESKPSGRGESAGGSSSVGGSASAADQRGRVFRYPFTLAPSR